MKKNISLDKKITQWLNAHNGWKTTLKICLMCLWVFASVVAAQFIIGIIMVSIFGREMVSRAVFVAVYSAISYVVAGILIIFVPVKFLSKWNISPHKKTSKDKKNSGVEIIKKSRTEMGLSGWPTWTDIGLAPVGFIVSLILAAGLVALFSLFPWFDAEQVQDVGFSAYMAGADRIIAFLTLVIIAPIAEEIIFRGWLYGKIRNNLKWLPEWGSIVVSALIVSLLFGIMHFQWNVGVNVFCLSLVLCGLREVTGTIYAGILTHMLKNGVAFYALYIIGLG